MDLHRVFAGMVAGAAAVALAVPAHARAEWQRGVAFTTYAATTYGTPASDASLARLAGDGNSDVEIVVTRYMADRSSNSIVATPRTPTDASVLHAMHTARSLGLAVTLKPQIDVLTGVWRGWITPSDPAAWFDSLEATTDHYADLAREGGASMLVVGTEFQSMSGAAHTARWQQLIAGVRERFSGKLTYAANFDEFNQIQFWKQLDYVGVDAYWSLASAPDPTVDSLVSAWTTKGRVAALRQVALTQGKPVLLTEIGYRSTPGAAMHPNWWDTTGAIDLSEQSNAYQAAYQALAAYPWFAGLYWWSWPAALPPDGSNSDYAPTYKPAEQVMKSWNAKLAPPPVASSPPVLAPPAVTAPAPAGIVTPKLPKKKPQAPCRRSQRKPHRPRTAASRAGRPCRAARAHRRTHRAVRHSRAAR